MFTEVEAIAGWINRSEDVIKVKMPSNFDELEKYNKGHNLECFHILDIEVINEEIKWLHHSALIFFRKSRNKGDSIQVGF